MAVLILVLFQAVASDSAAQQVDLAKFRKAISLPAIDVSFHLAYNQGPGFIVTGWDPPDLSDQVNSLRNSVQSAPSAAAYLMLGRLYSIEGKDAPAKSAFSQAVEMYRKEAALKPHDGRLLASFGSALFAVDQPDEAQKVLEDAARQAPGEWSVWTALGNLYSRKTLESSSLLNDKSQPLKSTPDQAARTAKLFSQASGYYDRAVTTAPREWQVYAERGAFRLSTALVDAFLHGGSGLDNPASVLPSGSLSDFEQASHLDPGNDAAAALVVFYQCIPSLGEGGPESLPTEKKSLVQQLEERLQKAAAGTDKSRSAGAFALLSFVQAVLMKDDPHAEGNARKALALAPSRHDAEALLTYLLIDQKHYAELADFCHQRLSLEPSVRFRLLAAKAYDKLNDSAQAESELRKGLQLEPDNFAVNLSLAALLLQQSNSPAVLAQVQKWIDKAAEGVGNNPSKEQKLQWNMVQAYYSALSGHLEDARTRLKQVLQEDPENQHAQDALAALGE